METIATIVARLLLSLLLILVGLVATALTVVWPPFGIGALIAGVGARLFMEHRNGPPVGRP